MPFDGFGSSLDYVAKFDQVIDLIEAPNQWIKHTYRSPWGGYCLKEALNMVGVVDAFEPVILKVAAERTQREFCCIESFNDCPTTTHGDVVAVLKQAREDVLAGRARLPEPRPSNTKPRWNEYHACSGTGWGHNLWQKLFCWR